MRFLIQVVNDACVKILDNWIQNSISKGLLIYVWISNQDLQDYNAKLDKFFSKFQDLKFFYNQQTQKIDLNLEAIWWEMLIISNFTLYGSPKKGTKFDFQDSAWFAQAKEIYDILSSKLKQKWFKVKTWEFWAMMEITSTNTGPLNYIWDL